MQNRIRQTPIPAEKELTPNYMEFIEFETQKYLLSTYLL